MSNVEYMKPSIDFAMCVLKVLQDQAEPSAGEIAAAVSLVMRRHVELGEVESGIRFLRSFMRYDILDYPDVDVTRYSLVEGGSAA